MINHVINKVSLQLSAGNYDQAVQYQQDAKHWTNHYLPSLLNRSLEEFSNLEEFIFIDKIEIVLTDQPWNISDSIWIEKLIKEIKHNTNSDKQVTQILKQWLFYLSFGAFERTAIIKQLSTFEIYFTKHYQIFNQSEIYLLYEVFDTLNSTKRLLFQHSTEFIQLFFSILLKLDKQKSKLVSTFFTAQLKKNENKTLIILQYLMHSVQQNNHKILIEIIELIEQNTALDIIENKFIQKAEITTKNKITVLNKKLDNSVECLNAGLVLLFPFIQRFFENIKLIENNKFINDYTKTKAVQSLHFIVTGKKTADEAELLLPKIICGINLQEIVELQDNLDTNIEMEINEFLNSVIQHWSILQNTSIDGLRKSFLQRDGKLTIEDNHFLLQVAESGVDILLDKIPWGFRNYKLPWMEKTIITEWH